MTTQHTDLLIEYLERSNLKWPQMPNRVVFLEKTHRYWRYRLDVNGTPRYLLKLYRGAAWLRSERESLALEKLQELNFGAAPHLIHYAPGSPFFDGRSLLITTCSPGVPLTAAALQEGGRIEQLAQIMNRLYSYPASSEMARLGQPRTLENYWQEIETSLNSFIKAVPVYNLAHYPPLLEELLQLASQHLAAHPLLSTSSAISLVHGDLRLSNVVGEAGGGLQLVSWERFGAGDPAIDMAWFLFLNRAELNVNQKFTLLDLWQSASRDVYLRTRLLQLYPMVELRYLLSTLQGMTRLRKKPFGFLDFRTESVMVRDVWVREALAHLRALFNNFAQSEGRNVLEQPLALIPPLQHRQNHAQEDAAEVPATLVGKDIFAPTPIYQANQHPPLPATAPHPPLRLVFLSGPYDGFKRFLPLPERYTPLALIIGRQEEDGICLTYDPELSRQHARLTIEEGDTSLLCWLEDLGSHNGTFLGQKRLPPGRWGLATGEIFRVGRSWLRLELQSTPAEEVPVLLTDFANTALLNSLDEMTRQVLQLGEADARRFNLSWLGVEHLFIGLSRQPNEATTRLLNQLKLVPTDVRAALRQMAGAHQEKNALEGRLPLTPRLQTILRYSEQLAAQARENQPRRLLKPPTLNKAKINSEQHRFLLKALLQDRDSLPARLFTNYGYDPAQLITLLQ